MKKLLLYILFLVLLIVPTDVFSKNCDDVVNFNDRLSCLQKKYTSLSYKKIEENNCNLSKEACNNTSACIWLEKGSVQSIGNKACGIEYDPTNASYLCTYAADINGQGIYVELTLNYNFFVSAYFSSNEHLYVGYRNIVKISDDTEGENSALIVNDSSGEFLGIAFYCPEKIYISTNAKEDTETVERYIYGRRDEAKEGEILIEAKILADNTYNYMKYFEPQNPPETDIPIREPLICEFENLTSGDLRISSITYVNSNTITAQYIDSTGLVTAYNVDAIKSSESFANWQCPAENKVYVQIKDENDKLTAYIAYDKELLPDPDSSHEFEESGASKDPSYSDTKLDNVCEAIPDEIIDYLKEALKLIRWLGLVLMIVLGTLDFVKAAAADDQDAMKKASQNFIKRLIAVIILFLLPIIIELILSILSMIGFDFAKCENYHIINF